MTTESGKTTFLGRIGYIACAVVVILAARGCANALGPPNYDRIVDEANKKLEAEGKPPLTKEQVDEAIKQGAKY